MECCCSFTPCLKSKDVNAAHPFKPSYTALKKEFRNQNNFKLPFLNVYVKRNRNSRKHNFDINSSNPNTS